MDQILIGLFLSLLTRLVRNPAQAAILKEELLHIRDGINVIFPNSEQQK
jgi:hypothetical protein